MRTFFRWQSNLNKFAKRNMIQVIRPRKLVEEPVPEASSMVGISFIFHISEFRMTLRRTKTMTPKTWMLIRKSLWNQNLLLCSRVLLLLTVCHLLRCQRRILTNEVSKVPHVGAPCGLSNSVTGFGSRKTTRGGRVPLQTINAFL